MTANEAYEVLNQMILSTLDDDSLAEMGEQAATYELRKEALSLIWELWQVCGLTKEPS